MKDKRFFLQLPPNDTTHIFNIRYRYQDRLIVFQPGCIFAVVSPVFYGNHYTTHRTVKATVEAAQRRKHCVIISCTGEEHIVSPDGGLISTWQKAK